MANKSFPAAQKSMPGFLEDRAAGSKFKTGRRVHHLGILKALQDPELGLANIADLYRSRVVPVQTRNLHLLGRKTPARIIETLLGYEVKAAYKRIHCPDMVTARYVKLFTELGCRTIRLPYDPTVTADLLPGLERALAGIEKGVRELFPTDRSLQLHVLRRIYSHIRAQLKAAGRNVPPVHTEANA